MIQIPLLAAPKNVYMPLKNKLNQLLQMNGISQSNTPKRVEMPLKMN